MPSVNVQVSLPKELLKTIDGTPEAHRDGRSAVFRRALELYLEKITDVRIDGAYLRAYSRKKRDAANEFADLIEAQQWPEK